MNFDRLSDEELLAACSVEHAAGSFEALYRRHERLVFAAHLRRVRDVEIAAELTAETFAHVLASRDSYVSRGEGSGTRWLYTVAANVRAMSARRAASEAAKQASLAGVLRPFDEVRRSDLAQSATSGAIMAALEALPPDQRDAVKAYVLDEEPYEEMAERQGVAEHTIRQRVSRGLGTLRRQLKEAR